MIIINFNEEKRQILSYVRTNKEKLITYFKDDLEKKSFCTSEKIPDNLENKFS